MAENGRPHYTRRSYGVGERICAASPLLVTGSNLGQREMGNALPTTLARFKLLNPDAGVVVERSLYLDCCSAVRPRSQ